MAIRKEETANGRIILRHDGGSKAGELAGSLSTKALAGVDSLADLVRPPLVDTSAADGLPNLDQIYSRFATLTSPTGDQVPVPAFNPASVPAAPEGSRVPRTPAVWLSYQLAADLDGLRTLTPEQLENVFELNARNMKVGDLAKGVTEAQWRDYLATARAKITDPTNGMTDSRRAEMLSLWQAAADGGTPTPEQFAAMSEIGKRTWRARKTLEWNLDQIASWYDVSRADVQAKVDQFTDEYRRLAASGQAPDLTEESRSWSFYAKTAPKDPATVYAFSRADDPSIYPEATGDGVRFVALDLETTGKSAKDCEIVEIGIVEYDKNGKEISRWGQLVRPPLTADGVLSTGDEDCVAVHGIKPEDVADSPSFAEIIPELRERLNGAVMIGHNIQFDSIFLKTSLRRHAPENMPEFKEPNWDKEADTMVHAHRHLGGLGLENRKLKTIATHFGVTYDNGHRAEHDAQVAGEVFFILRQRLREKRAQ